MKNWQISYYLWRLYHHSVFYCLSWTQFFLANLTVSIVFILSYQLSDKVIFLTITFSYFTYSVGSFKSLSNCSYVITLFSLVLDNVSNVYCFWACYLSFVHKTIFCLNIWHSCMLLLDALFNKHWANYFNIHYYISIGYIPIFPIRELCFIGLNYTLTLTRIFISALWPH